MQEIKALHPCIVTASPDTVAYLTVAERRQIALSPRVRQELDLPLPGPLPPPRPTGVADPLAAEPASQSQEPHLHHVRPRVLKLGGEGFEHRLEMREGRVSQHDFQRNASGLIALFISIIAWRQTSYLLDARTRYVVRKKHFMTANCLLEPLVVWYEPGSHL